MIVSNFRSIFAACDKRSHICDPDQRPPTTTSSPTTVVPTKRSFRNSIKNGFDKIKEIAGNVVIKNPFTDNDNDVATATTDASELLPLNFTHFFEISKSGNLSYVGFHFTFFELTSNCQVMTITSLSSFTFITRVQSYKRNLALISTLFV